jgi:hypothetical protein
MPSVRSLLSEQAWVLEPLFNRGETMRPLPDLHEKRWIPRQHMVVPIHCRLSLKHGSGSASAWVRDFSSIGARVISNLPLSAGDELTLTVPAHGHPEMTIAATVRWIQGQLLGLEFKHSPGN